MGARSSPVVADGRDFVASPKTRSTPVKPNASTKPFFDEWPIEGFFNTIGGLLPSGEGGRIVGNALIKDEWRVQWRSKLLARVEHFSPSAPKLRGHDRQHYYICRRVRLIARGPFLLNAMWQVIWLPVLSCSQFDRAVSARDANTSRPKSFSLRNP